jgi:hypothetical protein
VPPTPRADARPTPARALVDWSLPWAILPATLHEIAYRAHAGGLPAAPEQQAPPAVSAQVRGASRTAGAVAVLSLRGVITARGSWLMTLLFGGGGGA